MTLEEHIENLKAMASDMPSDKCADWIDSLMAGVKALEQEPYDDAISRKAVMHILDEVGGDFDSPREAVVPIDYIADMVSELPSVTPQSVLDKIRAEIEAKCCITVGRENDGAITLHDVFEIIDKYKAEGSEE